MLEMYEIMMSPTSQLDMLVGESVFAGEPQAVVPIVQRVNLTAMLTNNSKSCVVLRVRGNSMEELPIQDGDWVIVDREVVPYPNCIVVAELNGGFLIKRFKLNNKHRRGLYLVPASGRFEPIELTEEDNWSVLGVVKHVIHPL